jgi:peptidoglycan/xylan/chitin deacetylase (PgdA/CDA1 family)
MHIELSGGRAVKRVVYGLYSAIGGDRAVWSASRQRLRILAYHGICADHLANERWIPPYFVTRSAFEYQMAYLRRHASVLPLREAIDRIRANDLPDRAVSVTFDDGYANNLHVAQPILQAYGVPATIFLATAYLESGDLFPYDRVSLIDLATEGRAWKTGGALLDYATNPLDRVVDRIEEWWHTASASISRAQVDTLRPLRAEEIAQFDADLIDFGAHTDRHCILRNEVAERRRREITISIEKTSALIGRPVRLFSYPNGQPGDYGEEDKCVLRQAGIHAAVTTTPASNRASYDLLELSRYSIGLGHSGPAFAAEVTGFRSLLGRR